MVASCDAVAASSTCGVVPLDTGIMWTVAAIAPTEADAVSLALDGVLTEGTAAPTDAATASSHATVVPTDVDAS